MAQKGSTTLPSCLRHSVGDCRLFPFLEGFSKKEVVVAPDCNVLLEQCITFVIGLNIIKSEAR